MDAERRRCLMYTEKSLSDKEWVVNLAYLCDIFNLLNELNLSLQGKMTTVIKLADKVAGFEAQLDLWGRRLKKIPANV